VDVGASTEASGTPAMGPAFRRCGDRLRGTPAPLGGARVCLSGRCNRDSDRDRRVTVHNSEAATSGCWPEVSGVSDCPPTQVLR
jgi:hypothetical protein